MKYFTFYWRDGSKAIIQGVDVTAAFNSSYGRGALTALDFYTEGLDFSYYWSSSKHEWVQKEPIYLEHREWVSKTADQKLSLLGCSERLCSITGNVSRCISFRTYQDQDLGYYYIGVFKENAEIPNQEKTCMKLGRRNVDPGRLDLLIPFIDQFFAGEPVEFQTLDDILAEKMIE